MEDKLVKLYAKRARLNAQLSDPTLRQNAKLCDRLCEELREVNAQIDIVNLEIYGGVQYGN